MAQRFGAENYLGVRRSFAVSILVSAVIAVGIIIVGTVFADNLLATMQTPSDTFDDAKQYLFCIFLGCFITIAYNLLANVLGALGDSRTPLYFLVIAAVFNIILDLVFIVGCGTGVAGAAIATVLSQGISVVCCIVFILKKFLRCTYPLAIFGWIGRNFMNTLVCAFPWARKHPSLPLALCRFRLL